jgi:hypothetical protein
LVVFVSTLVLAYGAPTAFIQHHPLVYTAVVPAAVPALSQWHSQDALGQYSYGYQGGPSAKTEVKTLDGITQGSYSYIDANQQLQTVNYVSDALGFRAAATNLPTPPVDNGVAPEPVDDTDEVKAARAEHLEAVKKAQNGGAPAAPEVAPLTPPEPVDDTVEVKAARAEHLKTVEEVKARNALAGNGGGDDDDTETIVAPQTIAVHSAPLQTVQLSSLPLAQTVVLRSQPQIQLAAAPHHYVINAQPHFGYSVYQNAGIPQLIG